MEENQINNLGQSPLERYQEQVKRAEQIATTFEQEMKKKAEEAAQFLYQEMIKSLRMIQEQEAAKAKDPNLLVNDHPGRGPMWDKKINDHPGRGPMWDKKINDHPGRGPMWDEKINDSDIAYIGRDGQDYSSLKAAEEAIAAKYYDKDITDKIKRNDNGRSR